MTNSNLSSNLRVQFSLVLAHHPEKAPQQWCFFFFCASSVIEPHGYCRSHNHTATRFAILQSIMPSARLARYRQRRYAKHCSAASPREALQGGANSRTGHQTKHIRTTSCTSSGSDLFFIFIKAKCVKRYCILSRFVLQ